MTRNVGESGSWWSRTSLVLTAIAAVVVLGSFQQTQAQTAEPVGDSSSGKDLFDGTIRFENGAPSCFACHSVAGIGALGGGLLGPDLTGAYAKFGEAGLTSILATTPFPTMRPIFSGRTLTEQEQAHLVAFLEQAAVSERPAAMVGLLALLGTVGAAFLLLSMRYVGRRRLTEVRRPMVARSHARIERSRVAKREQQRVEGR
ncbi:MAG: c-type cytochrome [Actinomycetota bacterium]|nr:c-type cytochrome [Actinomycetota bacterium]